ncbi:MAG: hypothetical protein HQL95_12360 [Magnetococcales bacterium]|nr:hypothetical protein [Magnetococcales bacterium]
MRVQHLIQMPELDGHAVTRVRSDPRFRDLTVLARSASALREDQDKSRTCGMNDHITKPIDKQILFSALLQWIPPREQSVKVDLTRRIIPLDPYQ